MGSPTQRCYLEMTGDCSLGYACHGSPWAPKKTQVLYIVWKHSSLAAKVSNQAGVSLRLKANAG